MDRSTKTFLAVFLTMGAFLVAVERAVRGAPLGDWWLPGALLLGGIISGLSAREGDETPAVPAAPPAPQLREWTIVTPTPLPAAAEKPAAAPLLAKPAAPDDALPFDDDELPESAPEDGDPIAALTPVHDTAAAEADSEAVVTASAAHTKDYLEEVVGAVAEDDSAAKATLEAELKAVEQAAEDAGEAVGALDTPDTPPAPVEKSAAIDDAVFTKDEQALEGAKLAIDAEGDDLTVIEGIGPKYRDALHAASVTSFTQIAALTDEALTEIIRNAGMRRPASVPSWAEQAALAAKNDWEGLARLQESLTGGRKE